MKKKVLIQKQHQLNEELKRKLNLKEKRINVERQISELKTIFSSF